MNVFSQLTKGLKFNKPDIDRKKRDDSNQQRSVEEKDLDHQSCIIDRLSFDEPKHVEKYRKEYKIRVFGNDVPNPFKKFSELFSKYNIPSFIQKLLARAEFENPTPIQKQAIPVLLSDRDVMAVAPTGSGKTLAFVIPILALLKTHKKDTKFRALIIVPTRELAQQMEREFQKFSGQFKICLLSKANLAGFKSTPSYSYDILISTPLRLIDGVEKKIIDLSSLEILILDEADRLLELNFLEQTDKILSACPEHLIKGLFTATLNSSVEALANTFTRDPIRIFVGVQNSATETISQKLLFVGQEEGKILALRQAIQGGLATPVLIFVDSIERADALYLTLFQDDVFRLHLDVIHSNKSQAERANIIKNFRLGKIWLLITTDLLARGIDFKGVSSVINYDFPETGASYIHRIGRTGRAGKEGTAVTFFTIEDSDKLRTIANVMKASGCYVPEYMLQLKKQKRGFKRKLENSKPKDSD